MASVSLKDIIEKMKLENLTPELDISKVKITQPDINRIALQMAGYFEHFEATRMQIIGFVEYTYMQGLPDEKKKEIYTKLLSFDIPGIVFCRELQPDPMFMEMAIEHKVPLLLTKKLLLLYGGNYPLAECKAGTMHFRSRGIGGCIWRRCPDNRRKRYR